MINNTRSSIRFDYWVSQLIGTIHSILLTIKDQKLSLKHLFNFMIKISSIEVPR